MPLKAKRRPETALKVKKSSIIDVHFSANGLAPLDISIRSWHCSRGEQFVAATSTVGGIQGSYRLQGVLRGTAFAAGRAGKDLRLLGSREKK